MPIKLQKIQAACLLHPDEKIRLVCLNEQCKEKRLCCVQCISEEHARHEIVSLRRFQQNMQTFLQENNRNMQKGKISKLFKDAEQSILGYLKILETSFLSKIHIMEGKIQTIFTEIHSSFTIPSHEDLVKRVGQEFGHEIFEQLQKTIKICSQFRVGTLSDTKEVIKYEICSFQNKISQCTSQILTKFDTLESQIAKLKFHSVKDQGPLVFHPTNKCHDICILDQEQIVEKKKNSGSRTMALAKNPISPINNRCTFEILSDGSGIPSLAIGVCILSFVKNSMFSNCIGFRRGVYAIDQASQSNWGGVQQSGVSTSWNHDKQSKSNVFTPITFRQGDKVTIEVDYETEEIIFMIDGDEEFEEIWEMPINTSLKDLYPFVCLTNSGASVRIQE